MKNRSDLPRHRDIYSSAHRKSWHVGDDSRLPEGLSEPASSWHREVKRYRLRNRLLMGGFFFLIFTTVMTVVLSDRSSRRLPSPIQPTPYFAELNQQMPEVDLRNARFASTPLNPRMVLLTSELKESNDSPLIGPQKLTPQSIKQVAFELVSAENASQNGQSDKSLGHYEKALELFPDLQGISSLLGLEYLRIGDYARAAEALRKAIGEDETTAALANNLAIACIQIGSLDEAESILLQTRSQNPEYAPAYFNHATLLLKEQRYEEAAKAFHEYLRRNPADIKATHSYAFTLLELKDWDQATPVLQLLANQNPDSAPVFFRLAQALAHRNDIPGAMDALQHGTRLLDPRKSLAWLSEDHFNLLRSEPEFKMLIEELGREPDES